MIKMILAVGENGELGYQGLLPWHCPEDLKYFKKVTSGCPVIMGRKTFESLPFENGLPNRHNCVITSNAKYPKGTEVHYTTMEDVKETLPYNEHLNEDWWVIGGKSVYEELLPFVDEVYITTIAGDYKADTFFDTSVFKGWVCEERIQLAENAVVRVLRREDDNTISDLPEWEQEEIMEGY